MEGTDSAADSDDGWVELRKRRGRVEFEESQDEGTRL